MTQYNSSNLTIATVITLVMAAILLAFSYCLGNNTFFLLLNNDYGSIADTFFATVTHLGETIPWVVALLLVLIFKRSYFWPLLACFIVSTLFVQGIKDLSPSMPRPTKAIADFAAIHTVKGVYLNQFFSFPSGHTATAFSLFLLACALVPKRWVLFVGLLYALLVGYSRIYLAQHFPRDVAGGMIVGVLTSHISLWLCRNVRH